MIESIGAKKMTIYLNESYRLRGKPVYELILTLLHERKVAGVSVFRGIAGYGSDRMMHTAKIVELSTNLPVKIEVVDAEAVIREVLPAIVELTEKGLIEVSDTTVIRSRQNL
jgi:uncharacterized protein